MGKHLGKGKLIYFSDDELDIIESKARLSNLNFTKYIRKVAVEGTIVVKDLKGAMSIINELSRIGNNINQIARKANETNSIYKADVTMLRKEYDELCHTLNQYLLELQ